MCDTIVVVRDGQVLLGKNSDRDANEAQLLEWHGRRRPGENATVQCTWIEIPDVATTNAVVLSRHYWMWGAEMGANEHGVAIGNEAVFTKEPYADTGLTGMDMVRLALERADTAAGAVDVLVTLLERYGQGGGCGHEHPDFTYHNSFLVADAHGAWVLETAGRHWAVEQVVSGVRTISNGLTIEPFASHHGDRLRAAVSGCVARRALTSRLSPTATVADVCATLRSHGARRVPRYSIVNGALSAPCAHGGGLLAASQTTASWVSDLRPGDTLHWVTATAAPCTSLYKPVRVDHPVDLGAAPDDHDDGGSLWWRHERLHRAAMRDPSSAFPVFAAERDAVEATWRREPPVSEDAFAEGDALLERWTDAVERAVRRDTRPWFVRRYWRTRAARARRAVVTRG